MVAAQQFQLIANAEQLMQVIAKSGEMIDGDLAACEQFLNRIYESIEGYGGLSIARANGQARNDSDTGASDHNRGSGWEQT